MPQLPDVLEANGYPFWGRRGHIQTKHNSTPIIVTSCKIAETLWRFAIRKIDLGAARKAGVE
jgi:hypothetical protein